MAGLIDKQEASPHAQAAALLHSLEGIDFPGRRGEEGGGQPEGGGGGSPVRWTPATSLQRCPGRPGLEAGGPRDSSAAPVMSVLWSVVWSREFDELVLGDASAACALRNALVT